LDHYGSCTAILGHTGPYYVILDYSGPHWTIMNHIGPYWVTLDHYGLYCIILDHILGYTWPYWTILCHTRLFWIILDHIVPYWTIMDHTASQEEQKESICEVIRQLISLPAAPFLVTTQLSMHIIGASPVLSLFHPSHHNATALYRRILSPTVPRH